jgi:hypothetical protein
MPDLKSSQPCELKEVVNRFVYHVWPKALNLVSCPLQIQGQSVYLVSGTAPIHMNTLEMWIKNQPGGYGYGVFHGMTWHQAIQSHTVHVSV